MRIRTQRDVWIFTSLTTLFAIICSEVSVGGLYLLAGRDAFHLESAIAMSGLIPILISVPISYYVARVSLALLKTQTELRLLAGMDPLTQLPNRRSFFRAAERILVNEVESASLLVIDADHFKQLNDSYGHAIGDKALVAIADILRANFRKSDLICRVGGEEFAILLPGTNVSQAKHFASRVVEKVAGSPLSEPGAIIEYSVSCGVADTRDTRDLKKLFKSADDAMYMAKKQGRNRVVLVHEAA